MKRILNYIFDKKYSYFGWVILTQYFHSHCFINQSSTPQPMVAFQHLKNFHIDWIFMLTLKILWAIVAKSNANVIVSAVKLHSIVSYLLVIFVIPHCFTQSTICSIIHITILHTAKGQTCGNGI